MVTNERDVQDSSRDSRDDAEAKSSPISKYRVTGRSTVELKTLASGVLIAGLVGAAAFFGWQASDKSDQLAAIQSQQDDRAHAEQIALDYAVGAASMDFKDVPAWQGRLAANTTPELSNKLKQAATSMEQIIAPLQWTSTSTPIVAKVRSDLNGHFAVDCFVSVLTKNAQAPDGVQSTATYRLTIDKNANWIITDVGGIDSALAAK
ncbi:hypothetical protein ACIGO9_20420 [Nocardia asteroides]|uniref:hypothetical protein n=1 Tax=Nocardia asteroides TaxID=1824 RepID=UPI0037CB956E